MNINNIIFDLDGTLIDSSDGVVEAVNYSLRQMGESEQPAEVIKSFIGYPLSTMYPHFTTVAVKELYHHFQIKAAETVVSSTVILPGVVDLLQRLKNNGFRMAIASTKITRHIKGIIEKFNWQGYFDTYLGGDEVEKVKPDPSIFFMALLRLNAQPSETLVIGDTVNDIRAAKAIPIKVAALLSPYGGKEKLINAKPDYFLESIGDLFNIVTNNHKR